MMIIFFLSGWAHGSSGRADVEQTLALCWDGRPRSDGHSKFDHCDSQCTLTQTQNEMLQQAEG